MIHDSSGNLISEPVDICDCGLTGGCEKCNRYKVEKEHGSKNVYLDIVEKIEYLVNRAKEENKMMLLTKKNIYFGKVISVWGVVDKDNEELTEQLPFYFRKDYAKSVVQQMNKSVVAKKKPYKIKKGFLFYLN